MWAGVSADLQNRRQLTIQQLETASHFICLVYVNADSLKDSCVVDWRCLTLSYQRFKQSTVGK